MIFQSANGQTGNHLVDVVGFHYTINDADKLVVDYVEDRDIIYSTHCLSDYNGKILSYGTSIPEHPGNNPSDLHQKNTLMTLAMRLTDSAVLVFYISQDVRKNWKDTLKQHLHYRVLNIRDDKGVFSSEPATLVTDKHVHTMVGIRDTTNGFWLVAKHDTTQFTSYYFNQSTQPVRSTLSALSKDASFIDEPTYQCKSSPSGNFIISNRSSTFKNIDSFSLRRKSLGLLAFDKNSGMISENRLVYQYTDTFWNTNNEIFDAYDNRALRRSMSIQSVEMSSNDTYSYISETVRSKISAGEKRILRVNNETLALEVLKSEQIKKTTDTLPDGLIGHDSYYSGLKLLNNRKLYLKKLRYYTVSNARHYMFDYIENSNLATSTFVELSLKSPNDLSAARITGFSTTPYNYLIVKPSITKAECTTQVTFIDKCDYSLPDTKVTYYAEDIAGSGVLVPKGENPTLNFTRSGNYLCKVILKSHLGTYKEVWYDTLRIRIPPVADFEAADMLVCAYVPLEFSDESISDTVNAATGELWVWTFGDGETQTIFLPFGQDRGGDTSVSHVYTTPGTYTVSLFYSNGFCDSTLVKNKYITVVDAPAPGFSIDDTAGCTPVTLTITDTITKNTTGKEYNYNDGRGWINIPVDQRNFRQTYTTAGAYWIVQRLYGYTNCVTQQDSIQVFLTPGFTEENSTHVALVSYQDVAAYPPQEEVVTIMWHTNKDTADSYEVYQNGKLIKELLADAGAYNSADDSLVLEREGLNYAVVALDSCGSKTKMGLLGKPIYVSGKVIGDNDMSIISHTGYEELLLGTREISYSLQTFEYGEWVELNSQNNTLDYEDPRFLNFVNEGLQLEKSYRVVGSKSESTEKTFSNILRLPYTPILFLPTAFTPNGDNLNDIWIPVTFGVEHYEVDIYNRYGQKIIHFTEQEAGWAAVDASIGSYMVIIRAKGTDNEWYNEKSTVTVIK
jgi:PKD repeat protein